MTEHVQGCKRRIKPEFRYCLKSLLEHRPRLPYRGRSENLKQNHIRKVSFSGRWTKPHATANIPDASQEAFSQFPSRRHASLEFLPLYLVPVIRVPDLILTNFSKVEGKSQNQIEQYSKEVYLSSSLFLNCLLEYLLTISSFY